MEVWKIIQYKSVYKSEMSEWVTDIISGLENTAEPEIELWESQGNLFIYVC